MTIHVGQSLKSYHDALLQAVQEGNYLSQKKYPWVKVDIVEKS